MSNFSIWPPQYERDSRRRVPLPLQSNLLSASHRNPHTPPLTNPHMDALQFQAPKQSQKFPMVLVQSPPEQSTHLSTYSSKQNAKTETSSCMLSLFFVRKMKYNHQSQTSHSVDLRSRCRFGIPQIFRAGPLI